MNTILFLILLVSVCMLVTYQVGRELAKLREELETDRSYRAMFEDKEYQIDSIDREDKELLIRLSEVDCD